MRKIFQFICMLGLFTSLLGNQAGLSRSNDFKENSPFADDPLFVGTLAGLNINGTLYTWQVHVTDVQAGPISPGSGALVQYDTSWGCSPDYNTNIPSGATVQVYGFYYNGDIRLCQSGSSIVYYIRDVSSCVPPPGIPALLSPADNETINDSTPTFTWKAPSDATKYELWLSASSDFSTQLSKFSVDSTSYTLTKALADGIYYWRVRGRHINGDCSIHGPFSAVRTVTIKTTTCSTPGKPALSSPANGSTTSDSTPTFSWNTAADATEFELQVDNNSDFSSLVINSTVSGTSFTPASSLSNGTYYWRVRGHNASTGCDVYGSWSDVWTVNVNACSTPGTPVLSGPANTSTTSDSTPTFSWNTTNSATEYELQVDDSSDFSSLLFNPILAGSSYTPSTILSDGTYYWRVRGHNTRAGCDVYGSWSNAWTVNVKTCSPPDTPVLSGPANNSTTSDRTPTFSWNAASGATEYQLQVDDSSDFSSLVINSTVPGTSFTPASSLAYGTYYWRVRGHNASAGCDVYGSMWSDAWTVILNIDATVEPSPSPTATETSTPPPTTTPTPTPPMLIYVPMNLLLNRAGFWEQEDNDNYLSANGPISSGQTAFGYQDDLKDYFYFNTNKAGLITVDLDHVSGKEVQLQLFYQLADSEHRITYLSAPPYRLSYSGGPGRYYVYITTGSGFNKSVPYTLTASYP